LKIIFHCIPKRHNLSFTQPRYLIASNKTGHFPHPGPSRKQTSHNIHRCSPSSITIQKYSGHIVIMAFISSHPETFKHLLHTLPLELRRPILNFVLTNAFNDAVASDVRFNERLSSLYSAIRSTNRETENPRYFYRAITSIFWERNTRLENQLPLHVDRNIIFIPILHKNSPSIDTRSHHIQGLIRSVDVAA